MPDAPYPLDQPTVTVLLNQQTRTVGFRLEQGDSHVTVNMTPSAAITMGLQMVTAVNSLLFPGAHQVIPPVKQFPADTDCDCDPCGNEFYEQEYLS